MLLLLKAIPIILLLYYFSFPPLNISMVFLPLVTIRMSGIRVHHTVIFRMRLSLHYCWINDGTTVLLLVASLDM